MATMCNPIGVTAKVDPLPAPFVQSSGAMSVFDAFDNAYFIEVIDRTSELIPEASEDPQLVLSLWYIRVQSLLYLHMGGKAAEEIRVCLQPLNSPDFEAALSAEMKPDLFKLRLLLVPVSTRGINHTTVAKYYSMAASARQAALEYEALRERWLQLVELCGEYALSSLIALRDYAASIRLCEVHYVSTHDPKHARALALLYLLVGDSLAAREWVDRAGSASGSLHELVLFTDDNSEHTVPGFSELSRGDLESALVQFERLALTERNANGSLVNTAVQNLFLLYGWCDRNPAERRRQFVEKLKAEPSAHLESPELAALLQSD